ncbi:MAG: septum formation protein Maf [Proteobacteria bacterium]|nr:septum formation protein Maf [Pseudomonadota bacterium]
MNQNTHPLILASSSIYRKELLSRLKVPFSIFSPDVDETRLQGETIPDMVKRLSIAKARIACEKNPRSVCIGSDEVAGLDGEILGKPLTHENAIKQLTHMSGKEVVFYTGVCVSAPFLPFEEYRLSTTSITFRQLTPAMIENYLQKEKPYQSAGSFKSETLGSALISRFESEDPTAIIGLPLIILSEILTQAGITIV